MKCTLADDVIARCLDGDVDPRDSLDIEAHARACDACRSALARSRHLDAAVAASARAADDDAAAARLLAHAISVTTVERASLATRGAGAGRAPQRRARTRVALIAAAAFVLGLGAMRLIMQRATVTPSDVVATPAPVAPAAELRDMLVLPDQPRSVSGTGRIAWSPATARIDLRRAAALLEETDLPRASGMQALARARVFGWPAPTSAVAAACLDATRLSAGRALLDSGTAIGLVPLARCLMREGEVSDTLAEAAAAQRGFRQRLLAALGDGCEQVLVALAARLADPELDRAVLARCRRDEATADLVAAACIRPVQARARVAFLLDLWAVVTRGGDDDRAPVREDIDRAAAWFTPLPPTATRELLHELQTTRSAEVRSRVFLALGARAEPTALPALLAWVESPNLIAATLAAYALGCYDAHSAARLREAARTSRRPELLWAALASQGDVRLCARLRAAGLPSDEVALLTTGRFRPEQIAAVASLLRGRALVSLSKP